jgi:transcription elongation GreA/GreB family factor
MSLTDQIAFKNKLKQFCRETIEKRVTAAREAMQAAQESANSEEKSSAGDKYETARAMGHLQKDMHARQITEYTKELAALYAIDTGTLYDTVQPGCFVETAIGYFFIAAGLGKQVLDEKTILFLSASAPLALALKNKSTGDDFNFGGNRVTITALY